ncbi:MAG: HEAT repeat domain-containing protein [Nannocystaceae bacterium]
MQSAISQLEAAIAEVSWSSLHHAYGSASDVPTLLRELASGNRGRQRGALHAFYGNIWHQGTIYPASTPTARCLLTLLRQSKTRDPGEAYELHGQVLTLLLHLASGYGEGGPELQDECRHALAAEMELYQQLLGHPEPRIRLRTAHLLGLIVTPPAANLLATGFSEESHPEVRAARAQALGQHPGAATRLGELTGERDPAVVLAILLAQARSSQTFDEASRAKLAAALAERNTLAELQSWQDPELEQAIEPLPRSICAIPAPARYALLVPFAELLVELDPRDRWACALAWDLLVSTFERQEPSLTLATATAEQRLILARLTQIDAAWETDDLADYMREHLGLEAEDVREYLCKRLGLEQPATWNHRERDDAAFPEPLDDEETEAPGVQIPALDTPYPGPYSQDQQALAHRCTEVLHKSGFQESRAWYKTFVQLANAGLTMQPAALGRRFGERRNVTVGLDFHAPHVQQEFAEATNYHLAGSYLKLVYTDLDDHLELTLRMGLAQTDDQTLSELAEAITASIDEVTLAGVLATMEPVAAPLLVEFGDSYFATLSRMFRN